MAIKRVNRDVENSKRLPKWPRTTKGKERFELILDCAEAQLSSTPAETLSIQEVSRHAGLPTQAVYRLFPSPAALIHGLAERYLRQLEIEQVGVTPDQTASWQETIRLGLEHIANFYNEHPIAMELILGSSISREVRSADRDNVSRMAKAFSPLFAHLSDEDVLAAMNLRMEIAVDIVDSVWSHSYYLHSRITPFFLEESTRAAISYIELYVARYSE